jgi:hypothetical protein
MLFTQKIPGLQAMEKKEARTYGSISCWAHSWDRNRPIGLIIAVAATASKMKCLFTKIISWIHTPSLSYNSTLHFNF